MAIKRMKFQPKYGDMLNFLTFHRNLPTPLSFRVQGKFAYPLSFINERASENESCLHHYHLGCRTNLPALLSFMVQGKCACNLSFINDRASEIDICL